MLESDLLYKVTEIIGRRHSDLKLVPQGGISSNHYEIVTRLFVDKEGYLRICDGTHASSYKANPEEEYQRISPKITLKEFEHKVKMLLPGDRRVEAYKHREHVRVRTGLVFDSNTTEFKMCLAPIENVILLCKHETV